MSLDLIKKRNGEVVPFERAKIENAIEKAYVGVRGNSDREVIVNISDRIMVLAKEMFVSETPTVEGIQDIAERTIAEQGDFDVARAYIVYRFKHASQREKEQKETLKKVEKSEINVVKRNGETVKFNVEEIKDAIKKVFGDNPIINLDEIISAVKLNVYDGITTSEINKAVVLVLKARIEKEPIFSKISARFLLNDLYREVIGLNEFEENFREVHKNNFEKQIRKSIEEGRGDKRLLTFDFDKLSEALDPTRDLLFEYMGAQILHDRYLLRDTKEKHLETPQYFWMRVAMGLSLLEKNKEEAAINAYNTISRMLYVPSTPTLLHSGTHRPQMSSCYLSTVEDDLSHIFKSVGDNAQLSKWSGGIGQDWTNVRATNAWIKSINTGSQGLIPFLKIVDATTASINRSGKRRGATAVYLETWHMDVEDFLLLRKNTGDDRRRTHDINTVNWIPDLFMKRVEEDGEWTLFSPEEVPDLHHIYGKRFEEQYVNYERMADKGLINMYKRIKAKDLWRKIITMLFETGHPWVTFKDPSNIRSPQDHIGVVHNSNLCTEITLNTSSDETAVCNLGSINLARHFLAGEIDKKLLASTVKQAIRMLDNVIDINFYPTREAENSNLRHRPIGLGMMGFQDLLYMMDLSFDSNEAVRVADEVTEFISYHAFLTSSELAAEKGKYSSYQGSKWSRNLLPIDTIEILEKERGIETGIPAYGVMDWEPVRQSIRKNGMRNSNCLAIAPTATIANITGVLPSIEPIYKNLYVKSNFSGEFTVLNKYLVNDLKKANLWTQDIIEKLKYYDGNLERIEEIPADLKSKYKEVFQIDAHWIVKHAAHRQKWIDQSQSVNIFTNSTSGKYISDVYFDAWKSGLKTTYYLRTLGASAVEKSTVDINKYEKKDKETQKVEATPSQIVVEQKEPLPINKDKKLHVYEENVCEGCQ